jgi:single-strand DNA-binding protein
MAGINKVFLLGFLGRDPELRYAQNGTPICSLNIATTRAWKDKQGEKVEETEWSRVTVFGAQAESCQRYLSKGKQVHIEGRLKTRSWDENGTKRYATDIIAESVTFLGSGGGGVAGGGAGGGGEKARSGGRDPAPRDNGPEPYDPGDYHRGGGDSDDDIPF